MTEEVAKKVLLDELNDFRKMLNIEPGNLEQILLKKNVHKILIFLPIQNLQKRNQLGLLHQIKPEWEHAIHSRFEHTVGVIAKCIIVCDLINKHSYNKFDENDLKELIVAATIHDCGHLPIAHATERALLSTGESKRGLTHEERIIPIFLYSDYFKPLREFIDSDLGLSGDSLLRIASLIDSEMVGELAIENSSFQWPKRAIQQLLSSELDLDRLDYILRDTAAINYLPVVLIKDKIINYVNGLSLIKTSKIDQEKYRDDDVELCLDSAFIESAFQFLVSRVLLYKYVYFSQEVRSFEGTLTYLLSVLFDQKNISINSNHLITISDEDFIKKYLDVVVNEIDDDLGGINLKNDMKKVVEVLKHKKVSRFKFLKSIKPNKIENPRLKEEFIKRLGSRDYIENLKKIIINNAYKKGIEKEDLKNKYVLFDVFNLKTGKGSFLVRNAKENILRTLKDYMNGSNMHRLCSEVRLDVYTYIDLAQATTNKLEESITEFYNS